MHHLTAILAESLWRSAGCPTGRDGEFWAAAERHLAEAVMRRFVDALVAADEAEAWFPAPSMDDMQRWPDEAARKLAALVLGRAVA